VADEVPGGTAAAEAEESREEVVEGQEQQQEEQAEPEAITALASEMGWVPRDQFRGDPDDWKPATDFIRTGKDIQRGLSRELRGVRDEVSRISRTSADLAEQVRERAVAERDAYWARVQAKGVEEGKQDVVDRAVDERMKIRVEAEKAKDTAPDNGPPPETAAFVERHKAWFNVDSLATMRAQEICDQLAKRGVAIPEQLQQAERAIRKEFPELFPKSAKQPAGVQTGQSRSSGGSSSKARGYADMPAESQAMARDMLDRHGIPLEKTAESYWKEAEKQRKVG
jgi:hypothetical protein